MSKQKPISDQPKNGGNWPAKVKGGISGKKRGNAAPTNK
jgi:hypothetical protein